MSGAIRTGPALASSAAQQVSGRSAWLRRLLWPSVDAALARRRDGAIALDAVFRALTGRDPTAAERADLLRQAKGGLTFDGLVAELRASRDALTHGAFHNLESVQQALEGDLRIEAGAGQPAPARVVQLHIMKTGGTSLAELLRQWAGATRARVGLPLDDLLVMPRPQVARLNAISGHLPFEALDLIPGEFKTATVLRDPVRRTISHYRELRRSEAGHRNLSLDEFVSSEVYEVPSGNYQARALAHSIDLAGAWVDYSPRQRYLEAGGQPGQRYPLQALFDSTPITMDDDTLLQKAMGNLSGIDFVGVTESLDRLATRVGAQFGLDRIAVPRLNASDGPDPTVPDRIRQRIEAKTAVDRALYDQAVHRDRSPD